MIGHRYYEGKQDKIPGLTIAEDYTLNETGRFWGMKPWEVREAHPVQVAELRAHYDVHRAIEAYYNTENLRRMDNTKTKEK